MNFLMKMLVEYRFLFLAMEIIFSTISDDSNMMVVEVLLAV